MRALYALRLMARLLAGAIARPIRWLIPSGLLDNTIFDHVRLCFFLLILFGPLFALAGWESQHRVDDILRRGATTEAAVTGSKVIRHKGTTYTLDLAWRDARGTAYRIEALSVSAAYFNQVSRMGPAPTIRITYLTDRAASRRSVALTDDPGWSSEGSRMIPAGLIPGLLGLAGTVVMTLWRNRRIRRAVRIA